MEVLNVLAAIFSAVAAIIAVLWSVITYFHGMSQKTMRGLDKRLQGIEKNMVRSDDPRLMKILKPFDDAISKVLHEETAAKEGKLNGDFGGRLRKISPPESPDYAPITDPPRRTREAQQERIDYLLRQDERWNKEVVLIRKVVTTHHAWLKKLRKEGDKDS